MCYNFIHSSCVYYFSNIDQVYKKPKPQNQINISNEPPYKHDDISKTADVEDNFLKPLHIGHSFKTQMWFLITKNKHT
jgi:phage terminase large subunit